MLKKDLGLFLLIVVVGLVVAILNPRFLSPINLGNTANLIGLFGLFSIGEGFVIITGGIDLAIGSMFALLGVIYIDLLVTWQLEWWIAVLVVIVGGVVLGAVHGFLVSPGAERKNAERQRQSLNIKTADVETVVGTLSGGNQQKVVLAKWLSMKPKVMIFDEPTRGIDVGSKSEIYSLMRGLADAGVAILMISSDMEEVIGVSDRIVVMQEGAISGTLNRDQFSEENVMRLAVARGAEQSAA